MISLDTYKTIGQSKCIYLFYLFTSYLTTLHQLPGYVTGNEMLQFGTQFCISVRNASQIYVKSHFPYISPVSTVAERIFGLLDYTQ
jgi:hypothetical protein